MAITSKKLSLSFFWSFLEQGSSSLISLLVQIVLARVLAPDAFGIMAILLVVINLVSTISQSGLGSALIQKKDATETTFSTAFWLSLAISASLYCIIFFCSPLIEKAYSMPNLTIYLKILGLSVFFDSINSIQRSLLQKEMMFKSLFRANFLSILIGASVGIFMAFSGFGVWSLIFQTISQAIIACIILFVQLPWKPSFVFNLHESKELFGYGWKICFTGILNTLYTGLSELVIGKTNTVAELGYYSQGRKWPNAAMGAVNNALQNVLFPALSTLQNDVPAFQAAIRKMLLAGFYITAPICCLSAVVTEPLIAILLGESWLPCTLIFQFACIGYVFLMPQVVNLRAYMALGYAGLYLKLQIIKVVSGSILFCFVAFVSHNIYIVAAIVLLHTTCCVLFVDMHPAKKIHGIGTLEQLKIILPVLLLSIFCSCITSLIHLCSFDYLMELIFQVLTFSILYLAGSKLFKLPGYKECKTLLKQFLNK